MSDFYQIKRSKNTGWMNKSYHNCVQVFSFIRSDISVRLDKQGRNNNEYCICMAKFSSHILGNISRVFVYDYKIY
jgi:hypothetical protein